MLVWDAERTPSGSGGNASACLRVRHRGDLLTLESGDKVDAEGRRRHVRFRRATVHYWTLEAATHTGRWERTGFRDTLPRLVDVLVTTLGWTIASLE